MVEIKSQLQSADLTIKLPLAVQQRLAQCLASDPMHITRSSPDGPHIGAIQDALRKIAQARPELGLPAITDTQGSFGQSTANAVLKYKSIFGVQRSGQPLDDIVGRMTISQIDNDLLKIPQPVPPPVPPLPSPPFVGMAGLHIANIRGSDIISDYYRNCGLETIGPGQLTTSPSFSFSTFEGLLDNLATRAEPHQVIVNHGGTLFGLIVKICNETNEREVGKILGQLANLAERTEAGGFDPAEFQTNILLNDCQTTLSVKREVILRLVSKLVAVRKRTFMLHFRACKMPEDIIVDYKRAFNASFVTFHTCRLLFIRLGLQQARPGQTAAGEFAKKANGSRNRFRLLQDPIGLLQDVLIEVIDIDGGPTVDPFSIIDVRTAAQIKGWAEFLLRTWKEATPNSFAVPVMWENSELTFHFPLEDGWRKKLHFV